MAKKGKNDPGREMSKTTLKLPKELKKQLKIRAVQQDRDMQDLFAEAVEQYLAKLGKVARAEK